MEQARLEVGQTLKGIVQDSKPYGLFVRLPQLGREVRGLLPISELSGSDKMDVRKKFPMGKEIDVEIITIDEQGRIRLSQKVMEEREGRKDYVKFMEEKEKEDKMGTWGELFKDLKPKS